MTILPNDINANEHLFSAFDHMETEVSAGWIVRFCQERDNTWEPFELAGLQAFYVKRLRKQEAFHFNRLIEPGRSYSILSGWSDVGGGWVVRLPDGRLQVTDDFVKRCYRSSPVKETP